MSTDVDPRDPYGIDRAIKLLRAAIGTPQEALARAYLEIMVDKAKRAGAK